MLLSEVKLHPSMKALPLPQGGAAGNVGVQEISLDNLDSSMKAPVAHLQQIRWYTYPIGWCTREKRRGSYAPIMKIFVPQ